VANNIVSHMSGGGIEIGQPTLTSGSVDNDHNLVYDVGFNAFTPGPGTLSTDPVFLGAANYHLSSTSPAINSGNSARVPVDLSTDLDGVARQVATVDMGAYETGCLASGTTWPVCGAPIATKPGPQLACYVADGREAPLSHTRISTASTVELRHLAEPCRRERQTGSRVAAGGFIDRSPGSWDLRRCSMAAWRVRRVVRLSQRSVGIH
jgi:hypothetical protein